MSTKINRQTAFASLRKGCIVPVILGCALFALPVFAQTVPQSAHDASSEWATLGNIGPGVHSGEDFLFAVVELPWRGNVRRLEAAASLRLNVHLGNYLMLEQLGDQHRMEISGLLIEKSDASIATPQGLRINMQVIESGPKSSNPDIYRRVVAIPTSAVSEVGFSPAEAEEVYSRLISEFIQRWADYPEVLEQLGFGMLSLTAERHILGQQTNMVNVLSADSVPLETRARYAKYLASADFRPASLGEWPGEYEVVALQLERYGVRSRRGLAWGSIACLDPRSEFSEQVQAVQGAGANQPVAVPEKSGPIFKSVVRCGGFVTFDDGFSSEKPAFFPELQQIFAAGEDLPAALSLALQSVEVSPAFAEGWGYLSAALRADSNLPAAKIASLVRLSLEPNAEAAIKQYIQLVEGEVGETARRFIRDAVALLD